MSIAAVVFGCLFLVHVLMDRGRGTWWQFIWPALAGILPTYIATRRAYVSVGEAARLGAWAGLLGTLVLLLIGTPAIYLWLPPPPLPDAPWLDHPIGALVLIVVSTAAIGVMYSATAVLAAVLSLAVLRPQRPADLPSRTASANRIWRPYLALFSAGFVGILSLLLILPSMMDARPLPPRMAELPRSSVAVLSLINPTLLLGVAVAVGLALAPRLGLRSHIAEKAGLGIPLWPRLKSEAPLALMLGIAASGTVVLLDLLLQPYLGAASQQLEQAWSWRQLVAGLLYGGITEELLSRWGFMSFVAWAGWKMLQRSHGTPTPGVMWGAIVVSSLVFGAGHLPIAATMLTLTPVLVARIVLLNAIGGAVFGWLYWRRSLEAAMLAHAAGHGVFAVTAAVSNLLA